MLCIIAASLVKGTSPWLRMSKTQHILPAAVMSSEGWSLSRVCVEQELQHNNGYSKVGM